jgi:hypothetical protein
VDTGDGEEGDNCACFLLEPRVAGAEGADENFRVAGAEWAGRKFLLHQKNVHLLLFLVVGDKTNEDNQKFGSIIALGQLIHLVLTRKVSLLVQLQLISTLPLSLNDRAPGFPF